MSLRVVLIIICVATALNCVCILLTAWVVKKLLKIIREVSGE